MGPGFSNIIKKNEIIVKFIVSGGIATTIDFICYYILQLFIIVEIAKLISILIANVWSYNVNKRWVFASRQKTDRRMLTSYVFCQIANIATNVTVNSLMVRYTGYIILSFLVATLCATIVNFLMQKSIVFKK